MLDARRDGDDAPPTPCVLQGGAQGVGGGGHRARNSAASTATGALAPPFLTVNVKVLSCFPPSRFSMPVKATLSGRRPPGVLHAQPLELALRRREGDDGLVVEADLVLRDLVALQRGADEQHLEHVTGEEYWPTSSHFDVVAGGDLSSSDAGHVVAFSLWPEAGRWGGAQAATAAASRRVPSSSTVATRPPAR